MENNKVKAAIEQEVIVKDFKPKTNKQLKAELNRLLRELKKSRSAMDRATRLQVLKYLMELNEKENEDTDGETIEFSL
jgi:hypothetical protein